MNNPQLIYDFSLTTVGLSFKVLCFSFKVLCFSCTEIHIYLMKNIKIYKIMISVLFVMQLRVLVKCRHVRPDRKQLRTRSQRFQKPNLSKKGSKIRSFWDLKAFKHNLKLRTTTQTRSQRFPKPNLSKKGSKLRSFWDLKALNII